MAENMNDAVLDEEEGIIELVDDEGKVTRFIFVDTVEVDDTIYYALVPEDEDEQEQFVVLKEVEDNGEYMLATIDDDDEYNRIGEIFIQRFTELPDEDEDEE